MNVIANTIDEFFESSLNKEDLIRLDKTITSLTTGLDRKLHISPTFTVLGYGSMIYSRKTVNGIIPIIAFAPQKGSINLYISLHPEGPLIINSYKEKLGKCSYGKTCIKFTKFDKLNKLEFERFIKEIVECARKKNIEFIK